jgi:hypothetical protein
MITIFTDNCNPISQILYDQIISSLQYHQLVCSCGASACLTGHGYYRRSIKAEDRLVPLRICRVKCGICEKTHALLLSSMVPYSQIGLCEQVKIISCYESATSFAAIMNGQPVIDESNIRYVIRQYHRHWRQRRLAIGQSLSLTADFISQCFLYFGRQFMQIKPTPNVFFPEPT